MSKMCCNIKGVLCAASEGVPLPFVQQLVGSAVSTRHKHTRGAGFHQVWIDELAIARVDGTSKVHRAMATLVYSEHICLAVPQSEGAVRQVHMQNTNIVVVR
jgi:hypothetical protein